MIKYVIAISQGNRQPFFISDNKKKWAYSLEDAKHYTRLCDATREKNLREKDNVYINALPAPPPAGYIVMSIIKIDLIATVFP